MTDTLCPDQAAPRPVLTRAQWARVKRAVRYAMTAMTDDGVFARARAASPAYFKKIRRILTRLIARILFGLNGFESRTSVATMRGFGEIVGVPKSTLCDILKRYWRYGFIERATPKIRRGPSKTTSPTHGWSPFWWCPSHWRIGPTLMEFFTEAAGDGTNLAVDPLENQNRTKVLPPSEGRSLLSTVHPDTGSQEFQNQALPSSGFDRSVAPIEPDVAVDPAYEPVRGRSPVPAVRPPIPSDPAHAVSQAIQGAVVSAAIPKNPVHPEGADLSRVVSGRASRETIERVQERARLDQIADLDHERRKAQIVAEALAEAALEAAQPPPVPPDPSAKPPGLEASIANFGRVMGIDRKPDDG